MEIDPPSTPLSSYNSYVFGSCFVTRQGAVASMSVSTLTPTKWTAPPLPSYNSHVLGACLVTWQGVAASISAGISCSTRTHIFTRISIRIRVRISLL